MIIYDGQKYACLNCIRGHRSTSCGHKDRVLLQVRRRGRLATGDTLRYAIVSKDCDDSTCEGKKGGAASDNGHKIVRVKSAMSVEPDAVPDLDKFDKDDDDNEVYTTEKYYFIPVGNGLYRKEKRQTLQKSRKNSEFEPATIRGINLETSDSSAEFTPTPPPVKTELPVVNPLPVGEELNPMNGVAVNGTSLHHTELNGGAPGGTYDFPHAYGQPSDLLTDPSLISMMGQSQYPDQPAHGHQSQPPHCHHHHSHDNSEHKHCHASQSAGTQSQHQHQHQQHTHNQHRGHGEDKRRDAPHVIGPMNFHANLFDDLGLTMEEAHELWPGTSNDELAYAPQCVMPGQCACGDDCSCADCYEHSRKRRLAEMSMVQPQL